MHLDGSEDTYIPDSMEMIQAALLPQDPTVRYDVKYHAQIDSGADRMTTANHHLIHDFCLPGDPSCGDRTHIRADAGQHSHRIVGY